MSILLLEYTKQPYFGIYIEYAVVGLSFSVEKHESGEGKEGTTSGAELSDEAVLVSNGP